jgi:hypothetical protein
MNPSERSIETPDLQYHFHFDNTFPEDSTQESVYEIVGRPMVIDVLHGYHGTLLAYGQTGSGKTHCIFGPSGQHGQEVLGLVPRATHHIFEYVGTNLDAKSKFSIECYFLEVYCEQLRDLLKPGNTKLQLKELPPKGCFVEGLTRREVTSVNEVTQALRFGLKQRAAANTRLNQHSSRSHAIFTLRVQQQTADGATKNGKLTLVDLAGSEKISKSCPEGDMLEEAKKINLSLSTLGHVIDALVDRRPHIPYRDSRLTRILEDSLGGNCRTTLLCTCSPGYMHFSETLSSLRFAARAKKVTNFAHANVIYACDRKLLNRIAHLRQELTKAHRKLERQHSVDSGLNSSQVSSTTGRRCSFELPTGASKEDSGIREETAVQVVVANAGSHGEESTHQEDPKQMQIQDLQKRLQVERQRSATLSVELEQREKESKYLLSRLEDRESQARLPTCFVSTSMLQSHVPATSPAVQVVTSEMPLAGSMVAPMRTSAPPSVVRLISRPMSPAPPSTVSMPVVGVTTIQAVHTPVTTASIPSRVTSTASSAMLPSVPLMSPRQLQSAVPAVLQPTGESNESLGRGARSHSEAPQGGARSASPSQHNVARQQSLGNSISNRASARAQCRTSIHTPVAVPSGAATPAKHTLVFTPREPIVRTISRMSSDHPTVEMKNSPRWLK